MPEVLLRLHERELASLKVQIREERGKGPVGRLRREQGMLPGVLYGHQQPPFAFKTDVHSVERIFHRIGHNAVFVVEIEGQNRSEQAIVREVQYHKVRGDILHLDLLRIDPGEKLRVSVPLHTTGVPNGVRIGGGALQHAVSSLEMECMASEMPSAIEIDITSLEIGDSVHVADLLEQEPRIVTDPEVAIVNVVAPRLHVEEEVSAELEEAEGEAAEGEEGEAEEGDGENQE